MLYFLKNKQKHLEISLFYTHKITIITCIFPEIWSTTDRILCHFGPFFAPLPPPSFNTSVTKIMIICYTVPKIWHVTDVIVIFHFGPLFAFLTPLTAQKTNIKKSLKKMTQDIIILYKWTKNHDHMLYCSWDMVCDRCNCYFSFWAISSPFTP